MVSLRFLANLGLAGLVALTAPWAVDRIEELIPALARLDLPRIESPGFMALGIAAVGLLALRSGASGSRRA
jgi:hypothetical protein